MADTKISALTALTGASVAIDDVLPIVDTSVTTTKKIRADELAIYMKSALIGGSSSQIQYNSSGSFAGASGITTDGTDLTFGSSSRLFWSTDLILRRSAAANLALGAADAASPVAQTISVQNVVAGTSNTAGANFTINGSRGTGNAKGGKIILQTTPVGTSGTSQNTPSTSDYLEILAAGATTGETDRFRLRSNVDYNRILWEFHYPGYGIGMNAANFGVWVNSNLRCEIGNFVRIGNLGYFGIGSTSAPGSDVCLGRLASGMFEIHNGTSGTFRDLKLRNIVTNPTTVSGLQSAATVGSGALGFVTDATATTPRSTVAGGGSNKVLVMSDGTNWLIVA